MKILERLVVFAVDCKIWLGRASGYVSMLNTGLLLVLVLGKLQEYGINISLKEWGVPIYVATMLLFMAIGYVDQRFGVFKFETSRVQRQNPEIQEIRKDIAEMKELLKER